MSAVKWLDDGWKDKEIENLTLRCQEDPETSLIKQLLDKINSIEGIVTLQSCLGHGDDAHLWITTTEKISKWLDNQLPRLLVQQRESRFGSYRIDKRYMRFKTSGYLPDGVHVYYCFTGVSGSFEYIAKQIYYLFKDRKVG